MSSPEGKPSKKLKTGETGTDSEGVNVKGEKKKKKKDSQNIPLSPTLWCHVQVCLSRVLPKPNHVSRWEKHRLAKMCITLFYLNLLHTSLKYSS